MREFNAPITIKEFCDGVDASVVVRKDLVDKKLYGYWSRSQFEEDWKRGLDYGLIRRKMKISNPKNPIDYKFGLNPEIIPYLME